MKKLSTFILLASSLLAACTPKVSYVDPEGVNNLTTNFSQNDLRIVAQAMSMQLIQSGKMISCKSFTISPVKNATDQYVDTAVMTNAMADTLTDSSAVHSIYVISVDEMGNQVQELNRQNDSGLYDKAGIIKRGKMRAAECRIDGRLTSDFSFSPDGKTALMAYTFFVQLINVEQGSALWRSSKSISKIKAY